MLIDSHCHLDFPDFGARLPEVVDHAVGRGVGHMVTISTHVARADVYREIAETYPEVSFTIGTHPHNAGDEPDIAVAELVRIASHPRCIAIGEAGLDFHYDRAPRDVQERVFRTHIAAAREARLPLVIHARDADDAMVSILTEEHGRGRFDAVLHCFSSGAELARVGVALGLFVSFSGILTFRASDELRRIASSIVPPERLMVETDAPFLAPVPHRGRVNEPAYVTHTAHVLGECLRLPDDEVARLTTANFLRLFAKARPLVLPSRDSAAA